MKSNRKQSPVRRAVYLIMWSPIWFPIGWMFFICIFGLILHPLHVARYTPIHVALGVWVVLATIAFIRIVFRTPLVGTAGLVHLIEHIKKRLSARAAAKNMKANVQ